ncbi:class I lanthipeptide [Kordia zhangzhouensis]|uniref:class I lanthipeptide n=1 Tax=Kordia zhangzhouensis TaxID=1620405 RepID=UPI0012FAC44E|nr:class I lanthipeptide [Kordia zhangzhouensis]
MKKVNKRKLQFSKIAVAIIQELQLKAIKGGTEPVSAPMSQEPDQNGICFAEK